MSLCLYFADPSVFPPSDKSIKTLRRLGGSRMSDIDSVLVINQEDAANYDYIAATLPYIKSQSIVMVQEVSDIRTTHIDSPITLFYASIFKEHLGIIHTRVIDVRGTDLTVRGVSDSFGTGDILFNTHMVFNGVSYVMLYEPNKNIRHDIYTVPIIPASVFSSGKAIVHGDNSNMAKLGRLYEQMLILHVDVLRAISGSIRPQAFNPITRESGYVTHISVD